MNKQVFVEYENQVNKAWNTLINGANKLLTQNGTFYGEPSYTTNSRDHIVHFISGMKKMGFFEAKREKNEFGHIRMEFLRISVSHTRRKRYGMSCTAWHFPNSQKWDVHFNFKSKHLKKWAKAYQDKELLSIYSW